MGTILGHGVPANPQRAGLHPRVSGGWAREWGFLECSKGRLLLLASHLQKTTALEKYTVQARRETFVYCPGCSLTSCRLCAGFGDGRDGHLLRCEREQHPLKPELCCGLHRVSGSRVLLPILCADPTLSDKVNYLTLKHPVADTLRNGLCLSYDTHDK